MKRLVLLLLMITTSSFGQDVDLLCKDMSWSNYKDDLLNVDIGNVLITLTIEDDTNRSYAKVLGSALVAGDYLMIEVNKLSIFARNLSSKNELSLNLDRYDGTLSIQQWDEDKNKLVWIAKGQCSPATSLF
jgi:hypothetical protein